MVEVTAVPSTAPATGQPTETLMPTSSCSLEDERVECCEDSDCNTSNGDGFRLTQVIEEEICYFFTCINESAFRFTLSWEGDDDLVSYNNMLTVSLILNECCVLFCAISVKNRSNRIARPHAYFVQDLYADTPAGTRIFYGNPFDPITGGRIGEDTNQDGDGFHVENIFFPDRAPSGAYMFFVVPFNIRDEPDKWTLTVFVDGVEVESFMGTGPSISFDYNRL
jgi:hypothetical protein